MNRRHFIKNITAGTVGMTLGIAPLDLWAKDDYVTLTILHTNDIHCHIEPFSGSNERFEGKGGLARISGLVKKLRGLNPNTLLFDAGDMFQGTPYFNYYRGELILKVMSEAGYAAGTIGNHEFDNGLEGILNALPNANFPLINSNYDFANTCLEGKFPKWKIYRQTGLKVGVYGLGIELKGLVSENNFGNTIYIDPLKTALEMEQFLKEDQKCDLVVCLSHLGLRYRENKFSDIELAKNTFKTNLIIGGHTHTFLEKPILQKNKNGEQVIVNQAWWGGLEIGKIDFVFERSKKKMLDASFGNKIMV